MKKIFFVIFVFSLLAYAGDLARKGSTGADQLLIPVGARSIATAGSFLSNITGVEAIYYNPAGLDYAKGTEAMFSFMSHIADINVSYFAAGTRIGDLGSFALSYTTLDFGDIPITTTDQADGTGSTYSPGFYTMGLTYSKVITDRVVIGVTGKLIHEGIMNASANGIAGDFGVQYRFPANLSIGVCVKNIGTNMKYEGSDLQQKTKLPGSTENSALATYNAATEEFQVPSYFELSMAYEQNIDQDNAILLGATFQNHNSMEDRVKFGCEYSFKNMFFVRTGYDLLAENNTQSIYGICVGAGIQYGIGEGMRMSLDFAYRQVKEFPTANQVFTLKMFMD